MALILFDLDGTLVDSAPDLCASLNRIRGEEGLDPLPCETLREYAGSGARGLLKIGFNITDTHERFSELKERFLADYQKHCAEEVTCFEGVAEMLDGIESMGCQWGVVTNKFQCFTDPIMKKLGLFNRAAVIVSGDATGKLKPHPDNMLIALEKTHAQASCTPYVGDDIRDSKVAATLAMPFAAASWGYLRSEFPIKEWRADLIAHTPLEIITWLKSLQAHNCL